MCFSRVCGAVSTGFAEENFRGLTGWDDQHRFGGATSAAVEYRVARVERAVPVSARGRAHTSRGSRVCGDPRGTTGFPEVQTVVWRTSPGRRRMLQKTIFAA